MNKRAKTRPEIMLWLSDARGQYIPRDFAQSFANRVKSVSGVKADNWAILEAGPDHEWYWEAWQDVCDSALVTDDEGVQYYIWQDGDCWLVPKGMEWADDKESFEWPDDDDDDDS